MNFFAILSGWATHLHVSMWANIHLLQWRKIKDGTVSVSGTCRGKTRLNYQAWGELLHGEVPTESLATCNQQRMAARRALEWIVMSKARLVTTELLATCNQQRMAARRALEWIVTSKALLVTTELLATCNQQNTTTKATCTTTLPCVLDSLKTGIMGCKRIIGKWILWSKQLIPLPQHWSAET